MSPGSEEPAALDSTPTLFLQRQCATLAEVGQKATDGTVGDGMLAGDILSGIPAVDGVSRSPHSRYRPSTKKRDPGRVTEAGEECGCGRNACVGARSTACIIPKDPVRGTDDEEPPLRSDCTPSPPLQRLLPNVLCALPPASAASTGSITERVSMYAMFSRQGARE